MNRETCQRTIRSPMPRRQVPIDPGAAATPSGRGDPSSEESAGEGPAVFAVAPDDRTSDEGRQKSGRALDEAARPTGEIGDEDGEFRGDEPGVEDVQVGDHPLAHEA